MDIRQFQSEVREWQRHNFPNSKPYQPLLGVIEEAGELSHAHLKMEQGIRGTKEEHQVSKIDAIGDLLVFLADYCNRNEIDLEGAVETTWNQVKKRDWIKFPKDGRTC